MYLRTLRIIGFRGIADVELSFREGLNVIIGGNNTGKTAVIDALRICLGLGYQRREVRVANDDFFVDEFGKRGSQIEFHLTFMPQDRDEEGAFYEMLAVRQDKSLELQMHVVFTREEKDGGEDRIRVKYWGGEQEGPRLPDELLDEFYFVHLGALRNSERDLLPGSGNRLGQLLQKLVTNPTEQKEYAERLNRVVNTDVGWTRIRRTARKKINEHLRGTTIVGESQEIDVDFVSFEYRRIVEQLKVFLPFWGRIRKGELQSRLREAEVKDKRWRDYFENPNDDELRIKPEFHGLVIKHNKDDKTEDVIASLLSEAFRKFEVSQNGLGYNNLIFVATVLGDIIERRERGPHAYVALLMEEPEAHLHPQLQDTLFRYFKRIHQRRIQVFITSHSPTITAKTRLQGLTVLEKPSGRPTCTALASLPLGKSDWPKLQRFLDVTKCQLFFAKGVILVEGISEALLLPLFAKKMGRKYELERNGVEVVNIGGVAFRPFAKLYHSPEQHKRLCVRCAILTDDDRPPGEDPGDKGISKRAEKALELQGGNLTVCLARGTFEYELFIANEPIVRKMYRKMHPKTTVADAANFVEVISKTRDKAEFAQRFAGWLGKKDSDTFGELVVPEYIQKAVKWVINGGT